MTFLERLCQEKATGQLPAEIAKILSDFYHSYVEAITANGHRISEYESTLVFFLKLVIQVLQQPPVFAAYHQRVITPIDYYHFGLDLLRPLVIEESSTVLNINCLDEIQAYLKRGDNVVLFANHQTEPDPQAISLLLEKTHPHLAEEMIFVAGHRVISDPLAIPFSLGRNLICIFSKKHLETPPEQKLEKQEHNQHALQKLKQLLSEGGKCIYVAPSGGRDRPGPHGVVSVAEFDPQSIEIFWLFAQHAERPTHFYPLALHTYALLPPPHIVEVDLGEQRQAQCTPISMAIGAEIAMQNIPGTESLSKKEQKLVRAQYIWQQVCEQYQQLTKLK